MQALYLKNGRLRYRTDYPKPQPEADEALIRISLAGICATDLEIIKGYSAGFEGVLGHEFVGVVEEAADPVWRGRRVVGRINIAADPTSPDYYCLGPEHVPDRSVLGIIGRDGVFADYTTLPLINLVPVPDEVPDESAVFTEPLAAALRIVDQVRVKPTDRIAVVGPGRLGMLIGKVLSLTGGAVTLLGRRAASLALPAQWGFQTGLVAETPGNSFDFVVEATGNEEGLKHSLRLVRPLGTLILKSTFAGATSVDLTKLVVDEINVIGSRCGPFEPAVRLLARKAVDVQSMLDGEYKLSDGLAACEHAARPGVRKILLRP